MLDEYLHILSDPAHTAVEFTFVLLDVLVIDAVRRRMRRFTIRSVRAEHATIDREHGHPTHIGRHRA